MVFKNKFFLMNRTAEFDTFIGGGSFPHHIRRDQKKEVESKEEEEEKSLLSSSNDDNIVNFSFEANEIVKSFFLQLMIRITI